MRMWMVNPKRLCRKHLLGEHVEIHMLVGTLKKGHSIDGFLEKGLVDPRHVEPRHDAIAREMVARGYHHGSPLDGPDLILSTHLLGTDNNPGNWVDVQESIRELKNRCAECSSNLTLQTG